MAQNDTITNITVTQRSDGSGYVDVYFTLKGPDSVYNIALEASFDAGSTYTYVPAVFLDSITGIIQGADRHVIWNGVGSFPGLNTTQARMKILAYETGSCPPIITDIDGDIYSTVIVGSQCWMKENLKTTKYRNNTNIPYVADWEDWSNLTTGANVWYDKDIMWKETYGALYNWYTTVNANGLCSTGWHVPTYDEWGALSDYIGGEDPPHGNELKSCRQVNSPLGGDCNTSEHPRWDEDLDNGNYGTDDYGFLGFPGGYREGGGVFIFVGYYGSWWSSTESSSSNAWDRGLVYHYGDVYVNGTYDKQGGRSIRCLRDN